MKRGKIDVEELGNGDGAVCFAGLEDGRFVLDAQSASAYLLPGERLSVWGRFTATVMAGEAIVTGCSVKAPVLVSAPLSHAAVSFYCPASSVIKGESFVPAQLKKRGIACVLRFKRVDVEPLLARLFVGSDGSWLRVAGVEEPAAKEMFPTAWQLSVDEIGGGRIMICGNRGVGKSTLFRFVVNRLLQQHPCVAVVDTDPGQSELGVPGTLTVATTCSPLLSPGFCAAIPPPWQRVLAIVVAGVSPDRDPDLFCDSVSRLAKGVPEGMPVVINTPGWITGLGLETLNVTHDALKPTAVLQLHDPSSPICPLSFAPAATPVYPLVSCAGSSGEVVEQVTASQLRDFSLTRTILSCPKRLVFPLSSVCIAIHSGSDVPDNLVLAALLHTVVALLSSQLSRGRGGRFSPELPCDGVLVGFGIVRGFENGSLVIESSCDDVRMVNVVARAMHDLPSVEGSSKNAGVNNKHYATFSMTGNKFILRHKDV